MHYVVTYHRAGHPEREMQASQLWFDTPESAEEYITYLETKTKGRCVYTVRPMQHPAVGDVRVVDAEDELELCRLANDIAASRISADR